MTVKHANLLSMHSVKVEKYGAISVLRESLTHNILRAIWGISHAVSDSPEFTHR